MCLQSKRRRADSASPFPIGSRLGPGSFFTDLDGTSPHSPFDSRVGSLPSISRPISQGAFKTCRCFSFSTSLSPLVSESVSFSPTHNSCFPFSHCNPPPLSTLILKGIGGQFFFRELCNILSLGGYSHMSSSPIRYFVYLVAFPPFPCLPRPRYSFLSLYLLILAPAPIVPC